MKALDELPPRCCKFALTDGGAAPDMTWQRPNFRHLFCGEPVKDEKSPYCAEHHARCHAGFGRDVRSTERMMRAVEQTVVYRRREPAKSDGRENNHFQDGARGVDALIKSHLSQASRKRRRR
jgi:hypothetical protein